MRNLIEKLKQLGADRLLENEPMSRHTSFRVGGCADLMFFPAAEDETVLAIEYAQAAQVPCIVIGNGSNLIVRDGGIRGLVVVLGEHFADVKVEGNLLRAQAGASLAHIASAAQEHGLSGLEFASGIPGTLGGGCAMNAGAYGGQLSDVLVSARVYIGGEIRTLSVQDMQMGYRTTYPLREGGIVLSAEFALKADDPALIRERMRDLNQRRRDKQPLNLPSAGSTFKRPEGNFAGTLIEQCGLKGCTVGGAQVSEKHAGFIVNIGGATADDILKLIAHVQETVLQQTGYRLETEVRILGEA